MKYAMQCKIEKERDLEIAMNANTKLSTQCIITASQGKQFIIMIRRNITFKDRGLTVSLYKAIVRLRLEKCVQAWKPYASKDITMLVKNTK